MELITAVPKDSAIQKPTTGESLPTGGSGPWLALSTSGWSPPRPHLQSGQVDLQSLVDGQLHFGARQGEPVPPETGHRRG